MLLLLVKVCEALTMIIIAVFLIADAVYAIVLPLILTHNVGILIVQALFNVPFLIVGGMYLVLRNLNLLREPANQCRLPESIVKRFRLLINKGTAYSSEDMSDDLDYFVPGTETRTFAKFVTFTSVFWLMGFSCFWPTSLSWIDSSMREQDALIGVIVRHWRVVTGVYWVGSPVTSVCFIFLIAAIVSLFKCYESKTWPPARTGKTLAVLWFLWIVANGFVCVEARFLFEEYYWLLVADLIRVLFYGLLVIYLTVTSLGPSWLKKEEDGLWP
jgi:hypothetical protein